MQPTLLTFRRGAAHLDPGGGGAAAARPREIRGGGRGPAAAAAYRHAYHHACRHACCRAIRSSRHSCALQSQGSLYGAPHEKEVFSPSRDRALHNQGSFCGAPHDEKGIFRPGAYTYMTIKQPCVYRHAQHTSRRRVTMQIRRAFEHIARARASAVRAHRRHSRSRPGLVIRQPEVWIRTYRVSSENGSLDLPG